MWCTVLSSNIGLLVKPGSMRGFPSFLDETSSPIRSKGLEHFRNVDFGSTTNALIGNLGENPLITWFFRASDLCQSAEGIQSHHLAAANLSDLVIKPLACIVDCALPAKNPTKPIAIALGKRATKYKRYLDTANASRGLSRELMLKATVRGSRINFKTLSMPSIGLGPRFPTASVDRKASSGLLVMTMKETLRTLTRLPCPVV